MRRSLRTRKHRIVAVAASGSVLALVATGAAAYYSQVSQTSNAQTALSASVTIVEVASPTGLIPGGPPKPIAVTVRNNNPEVVHVNAIQVAIGTFANPQSNTSLPACTAADFSLTTVVFDQDLSSGDTQTFKPTIRMIDNPSANQDNCRGQQIPLTVTIT